MTQTPAPDQPEPRGLIGPAKDFAAFAELEYERRRSADQDFDPVAFHEAVELVLGKLST
jgi:hypothetical protein